MPENPVHPPRSPIGDLEWTTDVLGVAYEHATVDLGDDPDGETPIVATLIRRVAGRRDGRAHVPAVLYVHGFTDYFFQTALADAFAAAGFDFYAVDLRKSGRSRRPGHTPHHITDLRLYDAELNVALDAVDADSPGRPVVVMGHSTGGLITALWMDRMRRTDVARHRRITGLVLNSPWFDLQGEPILRSWGTALIYAVAAVAPRAVVPQRLPGGYGESIHRSAHGEWDYNLDWKPLTGFAVTFGFINAVRRGHAALHRGLDVGVPTLLLRSARSILGGPYRAEIDSADAVLDTEQIARWAGCVGGRLTAVPLDGALHDVFLSREPVRERAYAELSRWLAENLTENTAVPDPHIDPPPPAETAAASTPPISSGESS